MQPCEVTCFLDFPWLWHKTTCIIHIYHHLPLGDKKNFIYGFFYYSYNLKYENYLLKREWILNYFYWFFFVCVLSLLTWKLLQGSGLHCIYPVDVDSCLPSLALLGSVMVVGISMRNNCYMEQPENMEKEGPTSRFFGDSRNTPDEV